MSFDVNIGRSQPIIKPASNMNNDGGSSGNTGYMMGRRKKKKDDLCGSLFDIDKCDSEMDLITLKFKVQTKEQERKSWLDKILGL